MQIIKSTNNYYYLKPTKTIDSKGKEIIPICQVIMQSSITELSEECIEALGNTLTFPVIKSIPLAEVIFISKQLKQVGKTVGFEVRTLGTQLTERLDEYIQDKLDELDSTHFDADRLMF